LDQQRGDNFETTSKYEYKDSKLDQFDRDDNIGRIDKNLQTDSKYDSKMEIEKNNKKNEELMGATFKKNKNESYRQDDGGMGSDLGNRKL